MLPRHLRFVSPNTRLAALSIIVTATGALTLPPNGTIWCVLTIKTHWSLPESPVTYCLVGFLLLTLRSDTIISTNARISESSGKGVFRSLPSTRDGNVISCRQQGQRPQSYVIDYRFSQVTLIRAHWSAKGCKARFDVSSRILYASVPLDGMRLGRMRLLCLSNLPLFLSNRHTDFCHLSRRRKSTQRGKSVTVRDVR